MSKSYYFGVLLLVIVGITISLLVTPSKQEVALMHLEDMHFENAFEKYKALWKAGDTSVAVAIPLAELYMQYGQVEKAVRLMEQFIEENPRFINARKKLGIYYLSAQRPDDYLRNLEEIQRQSPTALVLRELSEQYFVRGEHNKHKQKLEELVEHFAHDATESEYVALAKMFGTAKDYESSSRILEKLFMRKGQEVTLETAGLAVHLMLDAGKADGLLKMVGDFVARDSGPERAIGLAHEMAERGRADLALSLLEPFKGYVDDNPRLLLALVHLRLAKGEDEKVLIDLASRFEQGNLPDEAVDILVDLALYQNNSALLDAVAIDLPLHLLSKTTLLRYVEWVFTESKPEITREIRDNLGHDYLSEEKLVAAILNLAEYGDRYLDELYALEKEATLTDAEKFVLVRVYNQIGQHKRALVVLKQIPVLEALAQFDVSEVVSLFLKLGQSEEGLRMFEIARQEATGSSRAKLDYVWAMLAAGAGKKEALLAWINDNPVSTELLTYTYYISESYQQAALQLALAELLYEREASSQHRLYLSEALLVNKQYRLALSHLETLYPIEQVAEDLYLAALVGLSKNQEVSMLRNYEKPVNALIEKMLARKELTEQRKREIAWILVETGFKEKAQPIFFSLAVNAKPDSADVEDLVFLSEDQVDSQIVGWLENRVLATESNQEKAKWLTHLNNIGQAEKVVDLVESLQGGRSKEIADAYLDALLVTNNKHKLAQSISEEIEVETSPERLGKLAVIAIQENLPEAEIAEKVLRKTLAVNPDNLNVLRQLSLLAFHQGKYTEAHNLFADYLARTDGDYEIYYYYGETLWKQKKYNKAKSSYQLAIEEINAMPSKDFEMRTVKAHLLFRQNEVEQALELFRELVKAYPESRGIRVDFADMLMEIGKYEEAGHVLVGSLE